MHDNSLLQLRDMADQLSVIGQILDINPFSLRSKQIRQIENALSNLEGFITPDRVQEANQWKKSFEGLQVLNQKLGAVDQTQSQIVNLERQIEELRHLTRPWHALEETDRDRIVQQSKRAREFLRNQENELEASVIQRYNRSCELKNLMSYADQVPYLCDAIFHSIRKERYEHNIIKLNEKMDSIRKKIKTMTRAFSTSLVLCLFIATIPIFLPFAITLWKRKRKFESHLTLYKEMHARENKRLNLAEEGAVIVNEITAVVGQMSYNEMKDLLNEIRDLKTEFHDSQRFLSVCATILNFIDTHQSMLTELFGIFPLDTKHKFTWLIQNVEKFEKSSITLTDLQAAKRTLYLQKKQTAKGYERTILSNSIEQLNRSLSSVMCVPLSPENKKTYADICVQLPELLKQTREIVFCVVQNYTIDLDAWQALATKMQEYARKLALFVLDSEILAQTQHVPDVGAMSQTLLPQNLTEEVIQ